MMCAEKDKGCGVDGEINKQRRKTGSRVVGRIIK